MATKMKIGNFIVFLKKGLFPALRLGGLISM